MKLVKPIKQLLRAGQGNTLVASAIMQTRRHDDPSDYTAHDWRMAYIDAETGRVNERYSVPEQRRAVKAWLKEWRTHAPSKKQRRKIKADERDSILLRDVEEMARRVKQWHEVSREGLFITPPNSLRRLACGLMFNGTTMPVMSDEKRRIFLKAFSYDVVTGEIWRNEPCESWFKSSAGYSRFLTAYKNNPRVQIANSSRAVSALNIKISQSGLAWLLCYGDTYGFTNAKLRRGNNLSFKMLANPYKAKAATVLGNEHTYLMNNNIQSGKGRTPEIKQFYARWGAVETQAEADLMIRELELLYWERLKGKEERCISTGYIMPANEVFYNRALAYHQAKQALNGASA